MKLTAPEPPPPEGKASLRSDECNDDLDDNNPVDAVRSWCHLAQLGRGLSNGQFSHSVVASSVTASGLDGREAEGGAFDGTRGGRRKPMRLSAVDGSSRDGDDDGDGDDKSKSDVDSCGGGDMKGGADFVSWEDSSTGPAEVWGGGSDRGESGDDTPHPTIGRDAGRSGDGDGQGGRKAPLWWGWQRGADAKNDVPKGRRRGRRGTHNRDGDEKKPECPQGKDERDCDKVQAGKEDAKNEEERARGNWWTFGMQINRNNSASPPPTGHDAKSAADRGDAADHKPPLISKASQYDVLAAKMEIDFSEARSSNNFNVSSSGSRDDDDDGTCTTMPQTKVPEDDPYCDGEDDIGTSGHGRLDQPASAPPSTSGGDEVGGSHRGSASDLLESQRSWWSFSTEGDLVIDHDGEFEGQERGDEEHDCQQEQGEEERVSRQELEEPDAVRTVADSLALNASGSSSTDDLLAGYTHTLRKGLDDYYREVEEDEQHDRRHGQQDEGGEEGEEEEKQQYSPVRRESSRVDDSSRRGSGSCIYNNNLDDSLYVDDMGEPLRGAREGRDEQTRSVGSVGDSEQISSADLADEPGSDHAGGDGALGDSSVVERSYAPQDDSHTPGDEVWSCSMSVPNVGGRVSSGSEWDKGNIFSSFEGKEKGIEEGRKSSLPSDAQHPETTKALEHQQCKHPTSPCTDPVTRSTDGSCGSGMISESSAVPSDFNDFTPTKKAELSTPDIDSKTWNSAKLITLKENNRIRGSITSVINDDDDAVSSIASSEHSGKVPIMRRLRLRQSMAGFSLRKSAKEGNLRDDGNDYCAADLAADLDLYDGYPDEGSASSKNSRNAHSNVSKKNTRPPLPIGRRRATSSEIAGELPRGKSKKLVSSLRSSLRFGPKSISSNKHDSGGLPDDSSDDCSSSDNDSYGRHLEAEIFAEQDAKHRRVVNEACEITTKVNKSVAALGIEAPFCQVNEMIPPMKELHLNIKYQMESLDAAMGRKTKNKKGRRRNKKSATKRSPSLASSVSSLPPPQTNDPKALSAYIMDQIKQQQIQLNGSLQTKLGTINTPSPDILYMCYLPNYMWYQPVAADSNMMRPTNLCSGTGITGDRQYLQPDMLNLFGTFGSYFSGLGGVIDDSASHNKRRYEFWVDKNIDNDSISAHVDLDEFYDAASSSSRSEADESSYESSSTGSATSGAAEDMQTELIAKVIEDLRSSQMMMTAPNPNLSSVSFD